MNARRGTTLTELLVVTAGLSCLLVVATAILVEAKDAAHRAGCTANLAELGKAFFLYANDHEGYLPDCGAASPLGGPVPSDGRHFPSRFNAPGTCAWPYVRAVGNQANLWLLVREGYAAAPLFVCPATSDRPSLNPDPSPSVLGFLATDPATGRAVPAEDRFLNRVAAGRCSYSYQNQFGHPNTDLASIAPPPPPPPPEATTSDAAAPSTAAPNDTAPAPPDAAATPPLPQVIYLATTHRFFHPQRLAILADRNPYTRTDLVHQPVLSPDDLPEANSLNHHGAGQNVLYLGGEVEWHDTPRCGPRRADGELDNIYRPDFGRPDDPQNIPRAAGDSFLVP